MYAIEEAARALMLAMKAGDSLEAADGSDPRYWPEFTALEDALAAQPPQPDAGLGALAQRVLEASAKATPGPWDEHTQLDIDREASRDAAFIVLSRTAAPSLAVGYLALQERVRALEEHPVSAHCVYCKRDMDMADTASAEVAMVSHAKTCAAHPLRAAERLAQERGEALARLRATLEKPPILPSGYQYGQDARELYDFGWKQAMAEARAALAQAARPSAAAEKG